MSAVWPTVWVWQRSPTDCFLLLLPLPAARGDGTVARVAGVVGRDARRSLVFLGRREAERLIAIWAQRTAPVNSKSQGERAPERIFDLYFDYVCTT